MFDLKELDRFKVLGKTPMIFKNAHRRGVRLEVLAEEPANLFVHYGGKAFFIGGFDGYDVVQFQVPGVFSLTAKGGPVSVWTAEMDTTAVEIPDKVSFTRIMTRRARNPELEAMMQVVQRTVDQRIAMVQRDATLQIAAERRQEAHERNLRESAERVRAEQARRNADGSAPGENEDEGAST